MIMQRKMAGAEGFEPSTKVLETHGIVGDTE